MKLDRKIDYRRRLAAAADEARHEMESRMLRRLLHRNSNTSSSTPHPDSGEENLQDHINDTGLCLAGDLTLDDKGSASWSRDDKLSEVREHT